MAFNGLGMSLGNLSRLSGARSRSISAENPTGAKGAGAMATEGTGAQCARDLGPGWKVSPSVNIEPGQTITLADIEGAGAVQSIWITGHDGTKHHTYRHWILRTYWDGQDHPSVECPLGDFFARPWGGCCHVNSLPVAVNPAWGLNCFWEMPFRTRARLTLENISPHQGTCYYQINYTLTDVPQDAACFHAQFRRVNPLPYKAVYTILGVNIEGRKEVLGLYLFSRLSEVRNITDEWIEQYNQERSHESLKNLTPAEYLTMNSPEVSTFGWH